LRPGWVCGAGGFCDLLFAPVANDVQYVGAPTLILDVVVNLGAGRSRRGAVARADQAHGSHLAVEGLRPTAEEEERGTVTQRSPRWERRENAEKGGAAKDRVGGNSEMERFVMLEEGGTPLFLRM
jgi:hypothetical protein